MGCNVVECREDSVERMSGDIHTAERYVLCYLAPFRGGRLVTWETVLSCQLYYPDAGQGWKVAVKAVAGTGMLAFPPVTGLELLTL